MLRMRADLLERSADRRGMSVITRMRCLECDELGLKPPVEIETI
jgi:hypothetical protein